MLDAVAQNGFGALDLPCHVAHFGKVGVSESFGKMQLFAV